MTTLGRPPMPRHQVTLALTVDLSAVDGRDAEARAVELAQALEPRLAAMVRGHRRSRPRLLGSLRPVGR